MKYKIERDDEPKELSRITIYIGLERYRLTESNDDKLTINKMSDGDGDNMQVHPRYANEIDVS